MDGFQHMKQITGSSIEQSARGAEQPRRSAAATGAGAREKTGSEVDAQRG